MCRALQHTWHYYIYIICKSHHSHVVGSFYLWSRMSTCWIFDVFGVNITPSRRSSRWSILHWIIVGSSGSFTNKSFQYFHFLWQIGWCLFSYGNIVETWRYTASVHPCAQKDHTHAVTQHLFSCSWSCSPFLKNFETTFNLLVTQIRVLTQIMNHTDVTD